MNTFDGELDRIRENRSELVHPYALDDSHDEQMDVFDIEIPSQVEMEWLKDQQLAENNMVRFCKKLMPYFLGLSYTPSATIKMITYAIARHELTHYLNELITLELELLKGRQLFIPYFNSVYKATYPNADCIEETVANVWAWDNNIMRTTAKLQHFWRQVI